MNKEKRKCYVVGDDNITLQCAEILLANNYQLIGLVSPSIKIEQWCSTNSIPYIKNIKELEERCEETKFDYLFSIVNSEIISKKILDSPKYFAINYHNSPLPKYAGLYATSWAILNDEKHHAITWHIMNEEIDAGDILKQKFFPIEDKDTALSLNLKCYELAVQAFHELTQELAKGVVLPIRQNLIHRSYYGLWNKPKNFGFISWHQSAEDIDKLCRALNLGNYPNELGSPKLLIKGKIFHLRSYKILNVTSSKEPGTIVSFSEKYIQIATKTYDFRILELSELNGTICLPKNLIKNFSLDLNSRLDKVERKYIKKISACDAAQNPRKEKFWLKELLSCSEEILFLSNLDCVENKKISLHKIKNIPNKILTGLRNSYKDYLPRNIIVTAFLIYLYRLNNYKSISIEYSEKEIISKIYGIQNYFSEYVPFTTNFNSKMTVFDALENFQLQYELIKRNDTYSKDIFIRYPELRDLNKKIEISFTIVDKNEEILLRNDRKLNIYLSKDGTWFYVHNNTDYQYFSDGYNYFKNINNHILTLLNDIVSHPEKRIFELMIINKREQLNLIINWNDTYGEYDSKKLLHQYFEEQVLRKPDNVAAIFQDQSINYTELNCKANQLANYLRSLGIRPNDIVGISLNRSLELLICILGILKSGAAYLPLDPYYPKERINFMLNNSNTRYLIMDKETITFKYEGYYGTIIEINSIMAFKDISANNPEIINKPQNTAYVIYTSGTTGTPKGVAISHSAATNHMVWMERKYNFYETEIFLQKTPYSFDASVWEFFMPLFLGAKLIISPNDAHACPMQLIQLVQKNKVTVLQLVPSMLKEFLLTPGFKDCKSLEHLFCGGEVLFPEIIRSFFKQKTAKMKLHNLYGPTEATIDAITSTCTLQDAKRNFSRLGKPIMNTKLFVLDDEKQIVPTGIIGELYISGAGLASGYLNNIEHTKQKFIRNPYSNKNDRLYKTGDLVKWLSNGEIEYHGRVDFQVKIRGFRVELSEIESTLEKIHGIYQCIVKLEPQLHGSSLLSAYIVLKDNEDISNLDLRSLLKAKMPDYMIPNQFFIVDKFLFTPSGKLDRINIPQPSKRLNLAHKDVMPKTNIEKSLKNIWCSVLKIKEIGIHDDFFELGGNSLFAMQIISGIKNQFAVTLGVRKIFDHPTINRLAKEIEQMKFNAISFAEQDNLFEHIIVPIKKSGRKNPLFLVHPVGGSVFWYQLLGRYLDVERPLYGIQDPGIDTKKFIYQSLEEMASSYILAIKSVQPKGPYVLGGASFGATVAVEIAKQLEEEGESIASVLSLDGWAFYPILQKDETYFRCLMHEQNERILKKYIDSNLSNSEFLLELQWHREKMLMRYNLPVIKAKFILYKAKILTDLFNYYAPYNWWDNFVEKPILRFFVPGNHETMFNDPNVKVLADTINDSLNENMKDISIISEEIY